MLRGKIQSINADKGFGFIKPSAGGADLFFHCSAVDAEFTALTPELPVEYELDSSAEKPRAKKVISGLAAAHPKPQKAGRVYEGSGPASKSSGRQTTGNRSNSSARSSSGGYRGNATGRGPGSSRPSRPRVEIEYAFGYITKLPRPKNHRAPQKVPKTIDSVTNELVPKTPFGFISSTEGGYEYYFEPDFVKGRKFDKLKVGDYVRFIPKPNPENAKEPLAKAVEVVAKPINKQENNLKRHPKARRRKPTWRS